MSSLQEQAHFEGRINYERLNQLFERDKRLKIADEALAGFFEFRYQREKAQDPEALTHSVHHVQEMVAQSLGIREKIRTPAVSQIVSLMKILQGNEGAVIVMRHGAQALNEETKQLEGPIQKIRMMQKPHNVIDPLTSVSIAEAAGIAVVAGVLKDTTGKDVFIESSDNARSAQVTALLATAVNNHFPNTLPRWNPILNCIDYPTNRSDEEVMDMLGRENNGSLVWKREIADAVCGPGTYGRIGHDMYVFLMQMLARKSITVVVTHTQQTNAIDRLVGYEPTRYDELGFRVIGNNFQSTLFKSGIYSPRE